MKAKNFKIQNTYKKLYVVLTFVIYTGMRIYFSLTLTESSQGYPERHPTNPSPRPAGRSSTQSVSLETAERKFFRCARGVRRRNEPTTGPSLSSPGSARRPAPPEDAANLPAPAPIPTAALSNPRHPR